MIVNVRDNVERVLAAMGETRAAVLDKAIPRALNRVADAARAESARVIRDAGYGVSVRHIKSSIKVIRASRSAFEVVVRSAGRPIPLIAFDARQTQKGVTVRVKNGRKLIAGAFIATMPTGHKGVFVRKPGGKHRKSKHDREPRGPYRWAGRDKQRTYLPIRELYGPSVPAVFANQVVQDAMGRLVDARLAVELKHQISYYRSQGGRG